MVKSSALGAEIKTFVHRNLHAAVAEKLNEGGGTSGIDDVLRHWSSRSRPPPHILPLYMYCSQCSQSKDATSWEITRPASLEVYRNDMKRLVKSHSLRRMMSEHVFKQYEVVRKELEGRQRAPRRDSRDSQQHILIIRLTLVFADETSHANVLLIDPRLPQTSCCHLFEPQMPVGMCTKDTSLKPFLSIRTLLTDWLASFGLGMSNAKEARTATTRMPPLQQDDDLCQTWCVAWCVAYTNQMRTNAVKVEVDKTNTVDSFAFLSHGLRQVLTSSVPKHKDELILRFSMAIYKRVPFKHHKRHGVVVQTLEQANATSTRAFAPPPRTRLLATPRPSSRRQKNEVDEVAVVSE